MDNPSAATINELDIFNDVGQMIMILDPHHNIMTANNASLAAFGKSGEELKGRKCYEIFHGTTQPPENCPFEKMLHSKKSEIYDMPVETLGGTYVVSCTPLFNENDEIDRVVHIATDITKHKQDEDRMHKLNAVLEQRVLERTAELEEKNAELERFNKIFVGRELRMIELKKKIAELEAETESMKHRAGSM